MTSILQHLNRPAKGLMIDSVNYPQPTGILYKNANSGAAGSKDREDLRKACAEMESLFVNQLMTEMRKTVQKTGLIDGGMSEEIYTSMLDSALAREAAESGGIGLARQLLQSFEAAEEKGGKSANNS